MTTQTYQDAAVHLLAQAEAELAAGDTRQASEKGWGAAAQAVKAVCADRGWPHRNYKAIRRAVRRLEAESEALDIGPLFNSAFAMHVNFYEDAEDPEFVTDGLRDVQRLIDKLRGLQDVQRDQP